MTFSTMMFFGLAAATLAASTALTAAPASAQAPRFAQAGENPGAALNRHLRTLADQPRNVPALMGAGKAALKLGDAQAALTFFARAEEIAPRDGRVKAGMGSAFLQMEQPIPAMKFFNDAAGLGIPEAEFAGDRGLAFDLAGDSRRAQADYTAALRREEDPEIRRRLALSHAISGDRATALATIDAQLRSQDRAAWRTRAFIMALTGDPAEATKTTQTVMPGLAAQMSPFYAKLPSLNPAQRAMAVHFGHMPVGTQPMQTASASPRYPGAAQPPSTAPRRAPAATSNRRQAANAAATPAPAASSRRSSRRDAAPTPARSSRSALMRERLGIDDRDERRSAPRNPRAEAPAATPAEARTQVRAASNAPAAVPAPAPARQPPQSVARQAPPAIVPPIAVAQAPTQNQQSVPQASSEPVRPSMQSAPLQITQAAPQREAPAEPRTAQPGIAPVQLAPSAVAEITPAAAIPAPASPEAGRNSLASAVPAEPGGAGASAPAPGFADIAAVIAKLQPETSPVQARPSQARTELAQANVKAEPRPVKVVAEAKKETPLPAAPKAAAKKEEPAKKETSARKTDKEASEKKAPAKAAAPKEPSRVWVQVAGGADKAALPREFARLKEKAPKLLAGHSAWTTPLRFTNRLLVGPFKSEKEAQSFVNELNKLDFTSFSWTSPAGQDIKKLAAK